MAKGVLGRAGAAFRSGGAVGFGAVGAGGGGSGAGCGFSIGHIGSGMRVAGGARDGAECGGEVVIGMGDGVGKEA